MAGISIGFVQGSNSANPAGDAFSARTNQIQGQRQQDLQNQREEQRFGMDQQKFDMDQQRFEMEKQNNQDADMLKVFEYAGGGYVNEARFLAQQKGLQVPEEVFSNADFAQGLSLAGKIYGEDKVAAQKFTQAWLSNPSADMNSRLAAAQQAAGVALNNEDRQLRKDIALESWKQKNKITTGGGDSFTLGAGQTRYGPNGEIIAQGAPEADNNRTRFIQDAYSAALQNPATPPGGAQKVAQEAAQIYDSMKNGNGGQTPAPAGGGINIPPTGGAAPPVTPAPNPNLQKGVYAVQQLMLKGFTPQQISEKLQQGGATPAQIQALFQAGDIK